ncbi:MAG: MBL fold metallo-hydrolase [Chthonomonas sp.]|nr:MBL fold metallo-hydrolase [Chthonomonas sp.]
MRSSITFHGAARTVTGSKHLLESNGARVLIDCGMFQGPKAIRERNLQPLAFDPREVDCIVLTHAHMDHIGYIPRLVKMGFKGPIYCTKATKGLAQISLPDSGRIQEEDAYHARKRGITERAEPLYTEQDTYEALKLFRTVPYHEFHELPGKMQFRYMFAGHILGSAYADVYLGSGQRLLFSGDLGRWDTPIIKDPEMIDAADVLVIESTYGDRDHSDESPEDHLATIINRAISEGRVVIVPSFAIGRTQELLYYLNKLELEGRIGRMPVFVDSPMATSTSQLYGRSQEEWDDEMRVSLQADDTPIEPDHLTYVRDRNQSKELNSRSGPMLIIAGSGMANGGRVVHHLMQRLGDPRTDVVFTGYQAVETLGRDLLDGAPEVHIFGKPVAVRANVEKLSALSAHAGQSELFRFLRGFKQQPKQAFIVHGEPDVQDIFKAKIEADLGWSGVHIPDQGQQFAIE